MDRKCCFFIGHREASREIYPALLAEVERHICELDVTQFVLGITVALTASPLRQLWRRRPNTRG